MASRDVDASERKQRSLERQRTRNREYMKRVRQREKEQVQKLRQTAHELALQTHELVGQRSVDLLLSSVFSGSASSCEPLLEALEEAKRHTQELLQEQALLQCAIAERVKGQDRIALLVDDFQTPTISTLLMPPSDMLPLPTPHLSEACASELIQLNRQRREGMEQQWQLAQRSTAAFFGWEVCYFFHGDHIHHKFRKLFRDDSAASISDRAWQHALQLKRYRKTHSHLPQIVQRINDDMFVDARERHGEADQPRRRHIVYNLRFRQQECDGTIGIGTQTLPLIVGEQVDATNTGTPILSKSCMDLCLFIKLTPVREPLHTEHCLVEFSSHIRFSSADDLQRNALEMVMSLARWEEANVHGSSTQLQW